MRCVTCVVLAGMLLAGAGAAPVRWEYAHVYTSSPRVFISTPQKSAEGNSWGEVIADYTGRAAPKDAGPTACMNVLGAEGWELVSVTDRERLEWYFKRPAGSAAPH